MEVVEIAVRFGDTPHAVRQLATGTFRIGTAPDVDLAIVGLISFPLVDRVERGWALRVPAGFVARRVADGTRVDGTITLACGDDIELAIGALAIRVAPVAREPAIARAKLDLRWWAWAAGALAVHLLVLGVAHALADPPELGVYAPTASLSLPQTPEPEPLPTAVRVRRKRDPNKQASVERDIVAPSAPVLEVAPNSEPRRDRAVTSAQRAGILGGVTANHIRKLTGTVDLNKALANAAPIYREYEAEEKRFGGGRHYVPADSIKTGRYETVSKGRATGDHYALPGEVGRKSKPTVEHCGGTCTASGGLSKDTIGSVLALRNQSLLDCYERSGGDARGNVTIEMSIGETGKVIWAHGEGLGKTAGCVASAVRRTKFPAAAATTATYSLTFQP